MDQIDRSPRLRNAQMFWARCALLASTALALAQLSPAFAQQPPQNATPGAQRAATVIVLDGSNSMNARLPNDRNFKFVGVRDALRASLPKIEGTEVGLAAFGARRASDCNDAEVVVTPSTDLGRVTSALDRYQPRGFSPVVLALRNAAKALPQGVSKASIVLVLDDLASCRGEDPCAVAGALKRENPALAVHVVVLGPRPVDLPILACIVRQTGGQLFQVADGPGIGPAIDEALTVAGLDRRSAPQPIAATAAPPAPRAASRQPSAGTSTGSFDTTKPGLHVSARLSDGAPPLTVPTAWRIWRADPTNEAEREGAERPRNAVPVVETTAATISRQLPPGRYEIEAKTGLVTVRRMIDITSSGPTLAPVDLDAALLTIAAPKTRGAAAAANTTLEVQAIGSANAPVWLARTGARDLVVPPGSYRVRATAGLASAERVLTVGQGVTGDALMPLEAGYLVVEEQTPASGHDRAATQIILETDDPDRTTGRREVYRTQAARLELTIPAGAYLLTVRRDGAEQRDRLQIKPGETLRRAGVLGSVRLRLVSRIGTGLPRGMPIAYRIERLDVPGRSLQRWGEPEPVFALSPGRYRLEARVGVQNAVVVREIDIRAAPADQQIDLDTGAGGIQLKVSGADGGLGLGDVYWQIFSDRGEAVWRTGQAEPLMALGPGRYRARAELRDRTLEQSFDVRSGDSRIIEVGR